MVRRMDGRKKALDLGCTTFHDISVRESIDEVYQVFVDLFKHWPKQLKRVSRTSPPLAKDRIPPLSKEKFRSMSEESKHHPCHDVHTEELRGPKRKESVSRKFMKWSLSVRGRTPSADSAVDSS